MSVVRLQRSLGIEFPVESDPTKLHNVLTEHHQSVWRWECMCCGMKGGLHPSERIARSGAVRHANSLQHAGRLDRVRRRQSAALEGTRSSEGGA